VSPCPRRQPGAPSTTRPAGWKVGQPSYADRYGRLEQYAFDPSERLRVGKRSREWIAVGRTEQECLEEMARCLLVIRVGGWPR
jgi:hypothetical protein